MTEGKLLTYLTDGDNKQKHKDLHVHLEIKAIF